MAALLISEALRRRLSLEDVLAEWAAQGGLADEQADAVRWVAAGIRKAGTGWERGLPPAEAASGNRLAATVSVMRRSRPDLLSTEEAAEMLDLTPRRVTQLAREGVFGQQVSGVWVFTPDELAAYRNRDDEDAA